MPKFQYGETITERAAKTTRLGSGTAQLWTDKEVGKAVKLTADSRVDLCAAGDTIEGFVIAVNADTSDNYSIGSFAQGGRKLVLADGLQATPGTGAIAVGDYVVCGTVTAKDTALTTYQKVCKATNQPGAVPADLTAAGQQAKLAAFAWRVVAIISGTGAVGDTLLIERMN